MSSRQRKPPYGGRVGGFRWFNTPVGINDLIPLMIGRMTTAEVVERLRHMAPESYIRCQYYWFFNYANPNTRALAVAQPRQSSPLKKRRAAPSMSNFFDNIQALASRLDQPAE